MNPVFFYIPNLIGYTRVVLAFLAMIYQDRTWLFIGLYILSQGMDAVDGTAARHFNQSTKFGALLDMLTDRMSTMSLLMIIMEKYPDLSWVFANCIVLDIVSHWAQMYVTILKGVSSHKINKNVFLRFYYSFPWLLIFCVGNELFLVAMVVRMNPGFEEWGAFVMKASAFFFLAKQWFSVVQLYQSCVDLAEIDNPHGEVKTWKHRRSITSPRQYPSGQPMNPVPNHEKNLETLRSMSGLQLGKPRKAE